MRRTGPLGREALAALGAAAGQNVTATHGRHAGAEAVAALADEFRGLISALHDTNSDWWLRANNFNNITLDREDPPGTP